MWEVARAVVRNRPLPAQPEPVEGPGGRRCAWCFDKLSMSGVWCWERLRMRMWRSGKVARAKERNRPLPAQPPPQKQMGPTLLPTPLSPTRGHLRGDELGVRCFAILLCRSAEFRVCHRRSHRHPDPPSDGFHDGALGRNLRFLRIPHPQRAVPRPKSVSRSLERLRFVRSEDLSKRPHRAPTGQSGRERNDFASSSTVPLLSGRSHRRRVPPMMRDRSRSRHPGLKSLVLSNR